MMIIFQRQTTNDPSEHKVHSPQKNPKDALGGVEENPQGDSQVLVHQDPDAPHLSLENWVYSFHDDQTEGIQKELQIWN